MRTQSVQIKQADYSSTQGQASAPETNGDPPHYAHYRPLQFLTHTLTSPSVGAHYKKAVTAFRRLSKTSTMQNNVPHQGSSMGMSRHVVDLESLCLLTHYCFTHSLQAFIWLCKTLRWQESSSGELLKVRQHKSSLRPRITSPSGSWVVLSVDVTVFIINVIYLNVCDASVNCAETVASTVADLANCSFCPLCTLTKPRKIMCQTEAALHMSVNHVYIILLVHCDEYRTHMCVSDLNITPNQCL